MRALVVDLRQLLEQVRPLCLDDIEAATLAYDTALRFVLEFPSDVVSCPPIFNEELQAGLSRYALLGKADNQPAEWVVYEPTAGGSSWEKAWSAGDQGLFGNMAQEADALVAQGMDRETAAKLLRKYKTLEAVKEDILKNGRHTMRQFKTHRKITLIWKGAAKRWWPAIWQAWWEVSEQRQLKEKLPSIAYNGAGGEVLIPPWTCPYVAAIKKAREGQAQDGYVCVDLPAKLELMLDELWECEQIAVDTETTSLDPYGLDIVGLSLSGEPGKSYYIPLNHETDEPQLSERDVAAAVTPLLLAKDLTFHHFSFDSRVLEKLGVPVKKLKFFDILIAAYICGYGFNTITKEGSAGLKGLSKQLLGITMQEIDELLGKGKKKKAIHMGQVPVRLAWSYAAADADMTGRLRPLFEAELTEKKLWPIYRLEHRFIDLIIQMERNGVTIDLSQVKELDEAFTKEIDQLEQSIYDQAGEKFTLNNPEEMSRVLYDKLHLRPGKRNQKAFSTEKTHLQDIVNDHPIVQDVIDHREMTKMKSTYVENLGGFIHPITDRLHCSWNQTAVSTGRLSSSEGPYGGLNLMNQPSRSEELAPKIRSTFVAQPGWKLVGADASQIELRILAHVSSDRNMIADFLSGMDFHQRTASRMFRIPFEDVIDGQRKTAKNFNFGVSYGLQADGASTRYKITREYAQELIDLYYDTYPDVKVWQTGTIRFCRREGYVETIMGRRRYLPEILSGSYKLRAEAERQGMNMPIQGSAADIIKRWMIMFDDWVIEHGLEDDIKLILQVHDEVVLECRENIAQDAHNTLVGLLPQVIQLRVPLLANGGIGDNWSQLK